MAGKKGCGHHKYSPEEIEFLRVNYPMYQLKELTNLFNIKFNTNMTDTAIKSALCRFNILSGRTGYFEKGHNTFNKGKKWSEYLSPESQARCRTTCFNSVDRSINNSNHNELPVGTEHINTEGYIEVRVDYPTGNKAHRFWKYKHHIVWEKHNGPIPDGMNLIFADGNKQNCNIDNLILVSDSELLKLNQEHLIYKYIPEATKVGVTIVKIEERIRKKDAKK